MKFLFLVLLIRLICFHYTPCSYSVQVYFAFFINFISATVILISCDSYYTSKDIHHFGINYELKLKK